jgi:ATP-binding cassette subfamily B protein
MPTDASDLSHRKRTIAERPKGEASMKGLSTRIMKFGARLVRTLRLVWKGHPPLAAVGILLTLVQGLLPLLVLVALKLLIDAVTQAHRAGTPLWGSGAPGNYLLLLAGVTLAGILCRSGVRMVSEAQDQAVTDHVYRLIQAKSIQVDLAYYENSQFYDTLHRAQQEAPYRPTRILNAMMQGGRSLCTLIGVIVLLVRLHWLAAVVITLTALPEIAVRWWFARKLYHWQQQKTLHERFARYYHWMLTGDMHAKEIRGFGMGLLFTRRFHRLREALLKEKLQLTSQRTGVELLSQMLAVAGALGIYTVLVLRTLEGRLSLGDFVMYFYLVQRGQMVLKAFLDAMADLYEDHLFLNGLYAFLDLEPQIGDPQFPAPVPSMISEGIALQGVSFRYPDSEGRDVLKNIDLTIRPGEVVAVVGENGSGKSTMVKLLLRLYDPTQGRITVDGIDLRQFAVSAWRRHVCTLFQDFSRYQLPAKENIWLGASEQILDLSRVVRTARATGAHSVISRLPQKYDTRLGRWFEEGEEISLGQWQKVALARAFFREAPVVILDEPSSNLDARAEHDFCASLDRLLRGRMAVLVSHRFATIRLAHRIVVLENGRISETGTHADLMANGGTYRELFTLQAQGVARA